MPAGSRLTDVLNARQELTVRDASLVSLETGRTVTVKEIVLERREVYAVEGNVERGAEARRISTRTGRVEMDLGPYLVRGTIHVRPGVEPTRALDHPRSMVPMTHATISYESNGVEQVREIAALIVNRALVTRVGTPKDEPGLTEMPRTIIGDARTASAPPQDPGPTTDGA